MLVVAAAAAVASGAVPEGRPVAVRHGRLVLLLLLILAPRGAADTAAGPGVIARHAVLARGRLGQRQAGATQAQQHHLWTERERARAHVALCQVGCIIWRITLRGGRRRHDGTRRLEGGWALGYVGIGLRTISGLEI